MRFVVQAEDALRQAERERIFQDIASGVKAEYPGLNEAISFCRKGDILVVWQLDWLGRSIRNLIDTVNLLQQRGIGFKSLQGSIDTPSRSKLGLHIFSALAEFERDIIRERPQADLQAARVRGKGVGWPQARDAKKIAMAQALYRDQNVSVTAICATLKVSCAKFYKYPNLNSKNKAYNGEAFKK